MSTEPLRSSAQLLPFRQEVIEADDSESDELNGLLSSNGDPRQMPNKAAFLDDMPSWQEYVRENGVDALTLLGVGIAALGIFKAENMGSRLFPVVYRASEDIVYPSLAYPRRDYIIPMWVDALSAIMLPSICFALAQLHLRSFYDLNTAFWGNIWGLATTSLFQVTIKTLIGGFRPHFLDVCNPDPDMVARGGTGFQGIMFDKSICRPSDAAQFREAQKSFPSGHTTTAAASGVFLALYLNAKLKVFADRKPYYYKMLLFFAPLLCPILVAGALTVDSSHHWYDVLAGGVIGVCGAFAAFRMSYTSIWDYRTNHIPMIRSDVSAKVLFPPYRSTGGPRRSNQQRQDRISTAAV
ncbi:hypothetical protein FRB94_012181 [Tulasnella sp. JGI-2019a]|nr:hypothetical protein FRB94_012181 [Tulasnella sp. JGI-2019a]KAG9012734.1 hypothetical protein FRB93_001287 [Tulasnella sp. JGI-2019a]KAG9035220.1 hypothetical protein FRB95_011663 [Tulasnella sp. JGI-2019a]